jgi:hypothetical protein
MRSGGEGAARPGEEPRPEGGSGFAVRGAIEGFYGRPFSWPEREALVAFLGARGMGTYV